MKDIKMQLPKVTLDDLFTTQEEIGMDGANNFDYSEIQAKYLI